MTICTGQVKNIYTDVVQILIRIQFTTIAEYYWYISFMNRALNPIKVANGKETGVNKIQ